MPITHRTPHAFRTGGTAAAILLAVLLALAATGCEQRIPGPSDRTPSVAMLDTAQLLREADKAWTGRDWERSELYYSRLLDRADLPPAQRPEVLYRLADSAYEAGHYHQARVSLEMWADEDAGVIQDWRWHELYLKTLSAIGSTERMQRHLDWLLGRDDLPWEARERSAVWLAKAAIQDDQAKPALTLMADFYAVAPGRAERARFEADFLSTLQAMPGSDLDKLAPAVTAANQFRFPYAVVVFERARRRADEPGMWPGVWQTMRGIISGADLADTAPLAAALAELERDKGVPRRGVALALPLSGRYRQVGWKVSRGAGLAQLWLSRRAEDVDVRIINTDAPDWLEQLRALPEHYTVLGGPIRVDAFRDLAASGELARRADFAFLPGLGDAQEGRDAWRFFSSPEDQVRALASLAMDTLGVERFGVLYPDEDYGRRMGSLFARHVRGRGAALAGEASYPPGDHPQWGRSIARLLSVPDSFHEDKEAPLPPPDFGAVFLPDGWSQAQLLLPQFFFYEADSLLVLGPELWSRGLDQGRDVENQYFKLAVCPGAWWEDSEGALELQRLLTAEALGRADFWVALGFDFVRFARGLDELGPGWSAAEVNAALSGGSDTDFSMAPIRWDAGGHASQELYLFSPAGGGKALADPGVLAERMQRAKTRQEKRIEAYEERMAEEAAQ